MWRFVLAAVLGLLVGATGPADAGAIFSYTFVGHNCIGGTGVNLQCIVTGSFQVNSDHIGASGNTDISSFITNLSVTVTNPDDDFFDTFDSAGGFFPPGRDGHAHG
jgi:hypothetical protein